MKPTLIKERGERGESLVEVLAALAVLLLVMVGVLQLFTMAVLSYRVAAAQTEMTEKAQAVVEIIRLVESNGTGGSSGILPLSAGVRSLPTSDADTGYTFWGPDGFGVVQPDAQYRLSYQVADDGSDWLVTVFVEPGSAGESGGTYLGPVGQKGIRYAARLPK